MTSVGLAVMIATALFALGVTSATAGAQTSSTASLLAPPSSNPHVHTYTVNCSVLGILTVPLTISTFDTSPGSVGTGQPVDLFAVRSHVSIPPSLVDLALAFGVTSLSGSITTLDFNATNATPSTVNAASSAIGFGPLPLTEGQAATFTVPSAPATFGPWVAGAAGGTIDFTPGAIDLTVLVPISCVPATPLPTLGHTVIR
jgi:hypothetical protein